MNSLTIPTLPSEDAIHEAVAQGLALAIAPPGQTSVDGVLWLSIEHRNARGKSEGAARKRRGVVGGVPDILVVDRGQLHGIELKSAKGVTSQAQKVRLPALQEAGVRTCICRSVEDVLAALQLWAIPHRRIVQLKTPQTVRV